MNGSLHLYFPTSSTHLSNVFVVASSMMSSMTGDVNIDGGLNESLRNLDLSNKSSGAHSGLTGDKSGGSAS